MNIKAAALTTALLTTIALAEPFTYQGQLNDAGQPADGTYDLLFQLFDDDVAGNQIGSTIVFGDLDISDGTFTVELDFGPGAFNSNARYLNIEVRPGASTDPFTPLTPRTPINPTPKAQHALVADTLTNPSWNQVGTTLFNGLGTDRVFINRFSPITSSEYFGVHSNAPGFVGMYTSGPAGSVPFYGYSVDGDVNAFTAYRASANDWSLRGGLFGDIVLRYDFDTFDFEVSNHLNVSIGISAGGNITAQGNMTADSFRFNQPKLNYYSISGDTFHSSSDHPFLASPPAGGSPGAYISTITDSGVLVAPIHLPQGANVNEIRCYIDDTFASNLLIDFRRVSVIDGSDATETVNSSGSFGTNLELIRNDPIWLQDIDNSAFTYHVRVRVNGQWPGNSAMRIKAIVFEYTTEQAD